MNSREDVTPSTLEECQLELTYLRHKLRGAEKATELMQADATRNYDFQQYRFDALRTAGHFDDPLEQLKAAALGLTGEAGEFADRIKKMAYHDHPLDKEALILELGDVMWYIALASDVLDVSMTDIARRNIEKLKKRYPDGFSPKRSINRVS